MKYLYILLISICVVAGVGLTQVHLNEQDPQQRLIVMPYFGEVNSSAPVATNSALSARDSVMAPALHPIAQRSVSRSGKMMFQSGKLVYRMGHAMLQTFLRIYSRNL